MISIVFMDFPNVTVRGGTGQLGMVYLSPGDLKKGVWLQIDVERDPNNECPEALERLLTPEGHACLLALVLCEQD